MTSCVEGLPRRYLQQGPSLTCARAAAEKDRGSPLARLRPEVDRSEGGNGGVAPAPVLAESDPFASTAR